jgi:23S rRNA pseudouridine1911/1915/1917 synthase
MLIAYRSPSVAEEKNMEDIKVIYEDNHLLVVIKPQNIPVQEDESKDKDLLTMLKEYLVEKYNKPGKAYLGLVHRLDRPTGGVMVFAKTSKAAERLYDQMPLLERRRPSCTGNHRKEIVG